MVEITSEEQNKVKRMKRTEDSLRDLWDHIKCTNSRIIGVPEEEEKKKGDFSLSCIGEGNGNPFQCSCLENPRDKGACWAAVYGVAQSWTRLSELHFHFSLSCIGEGNGNPLQCSCLENPRDRGAWWAAVHGVTQSDTTEVT